MPKSVDTQRRVSRSFAVFRESVNTQSISLVLREPYSRTTLAPRGITSGVVMQLRSGNQDVAEMIRPGALDDRRQAPNPM